MNHRDNIFKGYAVKAKRFVCGELTKKQDKYNGCTYKIKEGNIDYEVTYPYKQSPFKWKGNTIYQNDYLTFKLYDTIITGSIHYNRKFNKWIVKFIHNDYCYTLPLELIFKDINNIIEWVDYFDLPF